MNSDLESYRDSKESATENVETRVVTTMTPEPNTNLNLNPNPKQNSKKGEVVVFRGFDCMKVV